MVSDRTFVLPGTPKRFRIAVTELHEVETTSWTRGAPKTTTKRFANHHTAWKHRARTVAQKLRQGYVYLAASAQRGEVMLEAQGGHALDLSPDGAWLAIATRSDDDTAIAIELLEVATGIRSAAFEHRAGRVGLIGAVRFDGTTRAVHVAYDDRDHGKTIVRVDPQARELRTVARGDLVGCDAARRRLLVSEGATLRVLEDGASIFDHTGASIAAISPSGRVLAVHVGDRHDVFRAGDHTRNEIQLWDIDARAQWESVALPLLSRVRAIGVAPSDAELVVAWREGKGPLGLTIPDGRERWCLDAVSRGWAHALAGGNIAVASPDRVRVFDAERREVAALVAAAAHSLAFSRAGDRLAVGTASLATVLAT